MFKKSVTYIPIFVFFFLTSISKTTACAGCTNLDEYSFQKIRPHFPAVLVKFDIAFPYGEKHETFTSFAADVKRNKNLLVAEIGVKDYGEKDNEELAKKYGVTKEDFPAVMLFKQGVEKPVQFPKDEKFSVDGLRAFVRDNTDIYLGLPGCIEAFDKLAGRFVGDENKNEALRQAEDLLKAVKDDEQDSAKTYIVIMKKVIENGTKFVGHEKERIGKLIKGKLSTKKQTELQNRLNILRAFKNLAKDEL